MDINTAKNRIPYLPLATGYTQPKYVPYPIPSVHIEVSNVGTEVRLQQNPRW